MGEIQGGMKTDDYIDDYDDAGFDGAVIFNNMLDRGFYSSDEMYERGLNNNYECALFDAIVNDRRIVPEEEQIRIMARIDDNQFWDALFGTNTTNEFSNSVLAEGQRRLAEYNERDLDDDFEAIEEETTGRKSSYKIGFNFNGIKEIKEFENEHFFIPNSNHCIFKCLEKFYNLEGYDVNLDYKYTKSNITLEGYRKHLKDLNINENDTPQIFKVITENKKSIVKPLKHENKHTGNKYGILLLPQTVNKTIFHHSILLKIPEDARREKGETKIIKIDYINRILSDIIDNLSYQQNLTLSDKVERIQHKPPTRYENMALYTYDYETYNNKGVQIPAGVSIVKFEMSGKIDFVHHFILESFEEIPAQSTAQEKLQSDFIDYIFEDMAQNKRFNAEIYAHNGGGFDIILLKHHLKNPLYRWGNALKAGGRIKTIDLIKVIKYKVIENGEEKTHNIQYTLKFKDSLNFVLCSLKEACDTFKTKEKYDVEKLDFDIADLNLEYYKNATIEDGKEWPEWVEYMRVDSLSLAFVIVEAEKLFNTFEQSFIGKAGIPSIAWSILNNRSNAVFYNLYIHKDLATEKFIRSSQYGGRILHWRANFKAKGSTLLNPDNGDAYAMANETIFECPKIGKYKSKGLISLDANSLYPSAMAKFEYPHGKPQIINGDMSFKAFEEITRGKMYIAEITFKTGNQKHIITPYKQEKPQLLLYQCSPADQDLGGVYNNIDIEEMKHEGIQILTVKRAVIYKKKNLMFDKIISELYKMRLDTDDEVLKYIIKIILNATYGKFSEDIDTMTTYKEKKNGNKEIGHINLGNGQTEFNYRLLANCGKKPAQIGSFILSYARKIMNKLIRDLGRENILYGDTDSIYCTIESWEYLQKNNKDYNGLNSDLGGFKNDYGDGILISEAYFLDNKRYYLKFNKPYKGKAYKVKFNGLNWKKAKDGAIETAGAKYGDLDECELMANLFKDFWRKHFKGENINIINSFNQIKFKRGETINITKITQNYTITPEKRGQWTENENGDYISYPLNYDFTKPELKISTRNNYLRSKTPERSPPYLVKYENGEILTNCPLYAKSTYALKFKEGEAPEYPKFLRTKETAQTFILITDFTEDTNFERVANGTEKGSYGDLGSKTDYYELGKFGISSRIISDYKDIKIEDMTPLLALKNDDITMHATNKEIREYNEYEVQTANRIESMDDKIDKKRKYIKGKRAEIKAPFLKKG